MPEARIIVRASTISTAEASITVKSRIIELVSTFYILFHEFESHI
jgi:hypothetical protein